MSKAQLQALLAQRTAEFARYGGEVVRYASPEKPDRIKLGAFRAVPNLMAQEWEKELATAEQEKRAREWDRDLGAMLASSIGRRLTIVFRKTTGKPIRRYTGVLKEAPHKGQRCVVAG